MSTPRQRGLVDSVYALEQAAAPLGNAEVTRLVTELRRDVLSAWFPVLSAPLNMHKAEAIGSAIAEITGSNPLDVDDSTPWAGVETPDRAAFSNGELGANLSAAASDIAASASEAAQTTAEAARAALIPVGVAVCVLVGVFFIAKGVNK